VRKFETDKEEETWKLEKLNQAVDAYNHVLILHPTNYKTKISLATLYTELKQFEKAESLWIEATETNNDASTLLGYAQFLQTIGNDEQMISIANKVLESDSKNSSAYELLAIYYEKNGQTENANTCRNKRAFYEWIPDICELEYTDENFNTFELIQNEEQASTAIDRLVQDKSTRSTRFLLAICASHAFCGTIENNCFAELDSRIDSDPTVQPLLRGLLKNFSSTCTVRMTANILAKRKDETILMDLLKLLQNDVQLFTMGIPEALAILGNDIAVPYLCDTVAVDNEPDEEDDDVLVSPDLLRIRCCLALGSFGNDVIALDTLHQAVFIPTLSDAANAALFTATQDPKYLAALEESESVNLYVKEYLKEKHGDNEHVQQLNYL
jgi:tetratricopeptide (TPR) repeat protein